MYRSEKQSTFHGLPNLLAWAKESTVPTAALFEQMFMQDWLHSDTKTYELRGASPKLRVAARFVGTPTLEFQD
jgi:hypothetical protein